MSSHRISIALCTYNGAAHLPEQLASLARQTRLPDELIAFDDGSTDNTIAILNDFAKAASFHVSVEINAQRAGPAINFGKAISACSGDIISLCDQDDIWREDKLAKTEAAFNEDPDLGFVFSDADVCGENGEPLGYRLWNSVRFSPRLKRQIREGRGFDVLVRQNVVTGATLAFAARFRPMVLPIDPLWMHDGWIALLLSAFAPIGMIDEPLVCYRQHSQQAIGALQRTLYQEFLAAKAMDRNVFAEQAEMFEGALKRLSQWERDTSRTGPLPGPPPDYRGRGERGGAVEDVAQPVPRVSVPSRALELLGKKVQHCRRRSAIRRRECSRFPAFAELLTLRYRHFSLGWKSFAQDLFL